MAERSQRTPRVAPLVVGLVFIVLGLGALLHQTGWIDVEAAAVAAGALLVGGAAALAVLAANVVRAARSPGDPPVT